MNIQQGDVRLFQTNDDGDIHLENGKVEMHGGLESNVYISLFGGDENDSGNEKSSFNWWGNSLENEESKKIRSRTQHLLRSIPPISANLRRLEEAVYIDLEWLKEERIATDINVSVSLIDVDVIKIEININSDGDQISLSFTEVWKADL